MLPSVPSVASSGTKKKLAQIEAKINAICVSPTSLIILESHWESPHRGWLSYSLVGRCTNRVNKVFHTNKYRVRVSKTPMSKRGLHALRNFTRETYKWIQYIDQVLYSSRWVRASPSYSPRHGEKWGIAVIVFSYHYHSFAIGTISTRARAR